MKKITKPLGILAIVFLLFICATPLFLLFENQIYRSWVSIISPKHQFLQIENQNRIAIQILPNKYGIKWYGLRWANNGKQIEIYDARSQNNAKNLLVFNAKTGETIGDIVTFDEGHIPGIIKTLPFSLDKNEVLWDGCFSEGIFLSGKEISFDQWEPHLWKDSKLIKIFEPISSSRLDNNSDRIELVWEHRNSSPFCRHLTISPTDQRWILDTTLNTFVPLITARKFSSPMDYGVIQNTNPHWSPSGQEFVFGDGIWGIEIYNIETNKRRWLLEPSFNGYNPDWSNSGKWVSAIRNPYYQSSVIITTPDGKSIRTLESCEYTETPSWSPIDDKIAFICHHYDEDSCKDNKCENEQDFLVIWDISKINGN